MFFVALLLVSSNAFQLHSYNSNRYSSKLEMSHQLILVRHGESTWNKENKFTGWYDCPLSGTDLLNRKY